MNKFITILTFQHGAQEVACFLVPTGLDTPLVTLCRDAPEANDPHVIIPEHTKAPPQSHLSTSS